MLLLISSLSYAEQDQSFFFLGNLPSCDALPSGREPSLLNQDERTAPSLRMYCDISDRAATQELFITRHLSKNTEVYDRVDAVFYAITNASFSRAICQSLNLNVRRLRVIAGGDSLWMSDMRACATGPGYRSMRSISNIPGVPSFHPKFIIMSKNDSAEIFITSGNPTFRAKSNLDFNLLVNLSVSDPFYLWHSCVAQLLDRNYQSITLESLEKDYQLCRGEKLDWQSVHPMLLPFETTQFMSELAFWAGRSKSIKLLSQSYDSAALLNILLSARNSGSDIQYIRDDDILLTPLKVKDLQNEFSEFLSWDQELCRVGVIPRFLITKPGYNYLHAKVLIFEGDFGAVVYFGSANASHSSTNGNIENVYISKNKEINDYFIEYYNQISNASVTYDSWADLARKIGPYRDFKRGVFNECYK
jgi:hypothetical protein